MDDLALLREYVERGSEPAFSALMDRFLDLVYSVAWRQLGDPQAAQEVTQSVFCELAQKAREIGSNVVLVGWLCRTAYFKASRYRRNEQRRRRREEEAALMQTAEPVTETAWQQLTPHLDEAINQLEEPDRLAILLRFFQHQPLREVGVALGTGEDAARMRVNRALDKLRGFLVERGVALPAAALSAVIGEKSVQAAPVWTAQMVRTAALEAARTVGAPSLFTTIMGILVKAKLAALAVAGVFVALAIGAAVYSRDSGGKRVARLEKASWETAITAAQKSNLPGRNTTVRRAAQEQTDSAVAAGLSVKQALEVYAQVTGRTILRPANIPDTSLSSPMPADTNTTASFIESELASAGIEIVPDGEKFARVLLPSWRNTKMGDFLATLTPPAADGPAEIPAGTLSLRGVDFNQVLRIYAELRNRTLLRQVGLSGPPFWLTMQTPLTKAELVYALNVVLAMSGIVAVDDGDKFVQLDLLGNAKRIQARAPKPEPGATLIDPQEVPAMRPAFATPFPPPTRSPQSAPPGTQPPSPDPPPPTFDDLIAYYAKLAGREVLPSEKVGKQMIFFEAKTPLTKEEIIYGLETTLHLNGLAIIPVGEKSIRAGYISELKER